MADNEKLNIDIQSKFDISNVEKNVKKLQSDFQNMSNKTKTALDKPTAGVKAFDKSIEHTGQTVNKTFNQINQDALKVNQSMTTMGKTNQSVVGTFTQMRASMLLVTAAAAGSVHAMTNMVKQAAAFNELRSYFKGTDKDLNDFVAATKGTVTRGDLIRMSNQASDLNINLNQQKILFALAKNAGDSYGVSVEAGFQKVMQASNGSERALGKLGIALPIYTNNLNELVKASGKKLELMTVEEQETIRLEALMKSTNMTVEQATSGIQSQNDKIQALGVVYDEFKISIGQVMAAQVEHSGIIDNYNIILGGLNTLLSDQDTKAGKLSKTIIDHLIPAYGMLVDVGKAGAWLTDEISGTERGFRLPMSIAEAWTKAKDILLAQEEAAKAAAAARAAAKPTGGADIVGTSKPSAIDRMDMIDTWGGLATEDTSNFDFVMKMRQELIEAKEKQDQEAIDALYARWDAFDEKRLNDEKQKWDNIQSIAKLGTDVIGDQLYNAMTGQNVNIERAFKQLLARMVADFVSSGILSLLMRALNPASAGVGLFGMLGFASGVEGLQGAGTETSDSIPARLSKGESVLTAGATKAVQQSMGEGWITQLNKQYARSRSNMALGTFAGGIESLPSRQSQVVVTREIGDLYIDSQKVDYAIKTRGSVKNNRRMS